MGDKFLISLSAENRKNAQVKGGDELEILELQEALDKNETAKANFEKLARSKKKALVFSVSEAKTDETRWRRIEKAVQSLL